MHSFRIRAIMEEDREWVADTLKSKWGSATVISRGKIHHAETCDGFIATTREEENVGLLTFNIENDECEIVTLNSLIENIGVGTRLIEMVKTIALGKKCKRLWLVTSNDNLDAVRFYQLRGFRLVAIHRDAIDRARKLKPEIPRYGINSIPLRDEIEMEFLFRVP